MKAQLLTAVAAGAMLAAMPAFAQKSKDTLRVAFAESINSADVDVDPKPETSFTGRSVFDSLIYYSADAAAFKPLLAKSWKRVNPTTIEFELRDDVVLFGCLAIPVDGFGGVLRHAETLGVHEAEIDLRVDVALFCTFRLRFKKIVRCICAATSERSYQRHDQD